MRRLRAVDSHTGGEPTRVVIDGGPVLTGPLAGRVETLRREHDRLRAAVCCEPRGSGVLVGALLTPPEDRTAAAGVIFNNVGYLGMCGHGTIGVVTTLAWLGRLAPGRHRIETPVGIVTAELGADGRVAVRNVPAYRHAARVGVEVAGHDRVHGDVAWRGNRFCICGDHGQALEASRSGALGAFARRVRAALEAEGVTGAGGAAIDHIELTGPGDAPGIDGRNFGLCPGGADDRSPCGTGSSAKPACLVADGALRPGQRWHQQGIIGGVFAGSVELDGERVVPTIGGQAWITADTTLLLDESDRYCWGIPAHPCAT